MTEQASGLIDIIEPAVPVAAEAGSWPWLAAAIVLMLLLIAILVLLWKKKWPAYRALKHLHKLHRQIVAGVIPLPDGLVLLTQELRRGLKLAQQLPRQAPDMFGQQDKQLWQEFVQQLDKLRYQPGAELTVAQLDPIVSQIEIWLRRYCR
jgi:hypothetical protein